MNKLLFLFTIVIIITVVMILNCYSGKINPLLNTSNMTTYSSSTTTSSMDTTTTMYKKINIAFTHSPSDDTELNIYIYDHNDVNINFYSLSGTNETSDFFIGENEYSYFEVSRIIPSGTSILDYWFSIYHGTESNQTNYTELEGTTNDNYTYSRAENIGMLNDNERINISGNTISGGMWYGDKDFYKLNYNLQF